MDTEVATGWQPATVAAPHLAGTRQGAVDGPGRHAGVGMGLSVEDRGGYPEFERRVRSQFLSGLWNDRGYRGPFDRRGTGMRAPLKCRVHPRPRRIHAELVPVDAGVRAGRPGVSAV